MYRLSLTIVDAGTGETRSVPDIPVVKSLAPEVRVRVLAEAFAKVFASIEEGAGEKETKSP